MVHLHLYGVAMTQYLKDQKVLVQIFPNNIIGPALTWYMKLDLSKIKTSENVEKKATKVLRSTAAIESYCSSGRAKLNRPRHHINPSIDSEEAPLWPHDWPGQCRLCHTSYDGGKNP